MTRIITHFMTHSKPVFGQEWTCIYFYATKSIRLHGTTTSIFQEESHSSPACFGIFTTAMTMV
ncbi:hypothetical protein D1BOALGB6SA_758 [Olavius sp. associated proteobacterium Delta 1]|nr:hypothetical protein D1BOALGB6SA_758 [Olavius sp. associated proteobacterium Delta 1]